MGVVEGFIAEGDLIGDSWVTHIPILDQGEKLQISALITGQLIARVTERAVTEVIDDYDPEESAESALESWIGRLSVDELFESGHTVSGWSSNGNINVAGIDDLDPARLLPFLWYDGGAPAYRPVSTDRYPELLAAEQRFTPRILGALANRGIISAV